MRLPAYEFSKEVPIEMQEAIEDIRLLVNNGKYVPRISSEEPTYAGEEGEFVMYDAGASKYLFGFMNGGWYYGLLAPGPLP